MPTRRRRRSAALTLATALLALASGCRRTRAPEATVTTEAPPGVPRLLMLMGTGDQGRAFMMAPDQQSQPVPILFDLPGLVRMALPIEGGRGIVVQTSAPGATVSELWRVRTIPRMEREAQLGGSLQGSLFSVSRDGNVALFSHDIGLSGGLSTTLSRSTVYMVRQGTPMPMPIVTYRQFFGGEISSDGARALIAGAPLECVESYVGACPIHLFAFDLTTNPPTPRLLDNAARAYQPRFVPNTQGLRIAYQTTGFDTSYECLRSLNRCRHDLVTRDFNGTEPPQLLKRGAIGLYYSPTGQRMSHLAYAEPETRCTQLPCSSNSLHIGGLAGTDLRRVLVGEVSTFATRLWSPDDQYLAYVSYAPAGTGSRSVRIARMDGTPVRFLTEGSPICWFWAPAGP